MISRTPEALSLPGAPEALVDANAASGTVGGTVRSIFQYRELLKHLVLKDLKLKYRGSWLGFVWSLVNPLMMLVVYLVAFKYILGVRGEGFVFLLLLAILAWTFFSNSLGMAAGGIVDNGALIKTVAFPRAVLPISSVFFNLAQYLLTAAVFIPLMLVLHRTPPALPMLLFPVFLLLQVAFTVGLGLALATGTTFFRDIRHFLEIALSMMFWTTPIIYDFRLIHEPWQWLVLFSPLSSYVIAYQQIFYYREWPGTAVTVIAVVYALVSLSAGVALFSRYEREFSEQV
jgi:ABC-type polysaccharide/polyol phosphate export permease